MNITKGQGNYWELKDQISQFKKIIITGPHGSGTKITSKIIAEDFDLEYVRGEYAWGLDEYYDSNGIITYHQTLEEKNYSMFAPSQSCHLHRISDILSDVLVVFMYKNVKEIEQYTKRNPFVRNQSHVYEMSVYKQMILEDFPEDATILKESIEDITYYIWEKHQRKLIPNWIEIEHSSLDGHKLWINKEERKDFKEWQTSHDK